MIIINVLCLIATTVLRSRSGIELNDTLGLHFVLSEKFRVYQFFTYMFMHAGVEHILFNMFAVYMFGRLFEMFWGGKKFLFYYLVAGLGAAIVQQTVWYIDYCSIASHIADMPAVMSHISTEGAKALAESLNYSDEYMGRLNILMNIPTVGASGAVFGILLAFGYMFPKEKLYMFFLILLAFGYMFPKEKLYMFFLPIPIPARVFVIVYGLIELFAGVANFSWDNVAHFAHLGGLLFGLVLLLIWKKRGKLFTKDF
ncbi:MAG: rhomboid family intramembrane serine protease [Bacteroidetes bacterium]|nr:MAG: rhomboid family intramembrane serine protease [Bacteroidota bacterium]